MISYYSWLRRAAALLALPYLPATALAEGAEYKVGVETYYDKYREPITPSIVVDEDAYFAGANGSYTYNWDETTVSVEGQIAHGRAYYESPSGKIDDIPQYSAEARLLGGFRLVTDNGNSIFIPYIGLGSRYLYDNSKGRTTNLGLFAYDRRILHVYMPVGVKWQITGSDGWTYTPMIEFDPLLVGKVNTRLGNINGLENINTTQHRGYGWRGEFMVGQKYKDYGWEAGPYVRYWNVKDSNTATDSLGNVFYEPFNTRFQAGAGVRLIF